MTAPIDINSRKKPPKGAKATPGTKKRKTDWQAVERDYRTGNFTLRELGTKHDADHGLISRKAKKDGWTQDLAIAIKQATNAALVEQLVNTEVTKSQQKVNTTVQAAAEVNKNVILGHRTGLNKLTTIKAKLLSHIEQAADNMAELADIIEMARCPDENGMDRVNDALKKAMGRSALVDDLKKLSDVDEKVRKGEREAFNLNDDSDKGQGNTPVSRMTDTERAVRLMDMLNAQRKVA